MRTLLIKYFTKQRIFFPEVGFLDEKTLSRHLSLKKLKNCCFENIYLLTRSKSCLVVVKLGQSAIVQQVCVCKVLTFRCKKTLTLKFVWNESTFQGGCLGCPQTEPPPYRVDSFQTNFSVNVNRNVNTLHTHSYLTVAE